MATPEKSKKIRWSAAWAEARDLIWKRRWRLALGLVLVVVNTFSGFVLPWMTKDFIDKAVTQKQTQLLGQFALVIAGATIVQAASSFALAQLLGIAAQRAITDMRRRVEAHIMRLPVSYFDKTQSGVLIARIMNDAEGIRNLVGTGLVQLTGSLLASVVAMGVLFYINWKLTAVTIVVLAMFGGAMGYAFKTLRPLFRDRGKIQAEVTGRLNQALGGVRIVKTYTAEKREDLIFTEGVHKLLRNVTTTMTGSSGIGAFAALVIGAVGVLAFMVGGRAIVAGEMTVGDLLRYIMFTAFLTMPIIQLASIGTQMTEAFAGLDRIREILDVPREDADSARATEIGTIRGEVEFDNVWFEYNPDVPVMKGVSFKAPAGTTTALVGSSGSGKSTLLSLIMAFTHPKTGRILIDGRDLATLRLADYRHQLGVVLQDNFLFDGTVAENIAYGSPSATREDIERVSRIAHADEFIDGFEKKYDTVVGERGVSLSGGQKQRVAIARALVMDPRLLILDEFTSSVDVATERLIRAALQELMRDRTTFVIAHRLSTVRAADTILVLDRGRLVAAGRHEELLANSEIYNEINASQLLESPTREEEALVRP